jgi:CRISPR-associated protein Cas1
MQLFIDSFGAFLGVENGMILIKPKNNPAKRFALRDITAIFLTKGVRLTTDALILAIEAEIPVLLIDEIGHPIAQVWSGQYGSIATIRKNQALFSNHIACMDFIRGQLLERLANQKAVMQTLATSPNALGIMEKMQEKFLAWRPSRVSVSETAATFRGWEGTASRSYFQAISAALPEHFRFAVRSRRPARDAFNALLNYAYGILYAHVQLAIMKAGLDPYIGFLHADQYNSTSLVFDLIDPIRHWAETSALELCQRELVNLSDFHESSLKEGFLLLPSGKNAIIEAVQSYMNEKVSIDNLARRRVTHLDLTCSRLAVFLKSWQGAG